MILSSLQYESISVDENNLQDLNIYPRSKYNLTCHNSNSNQINVLQFASLFPLKTLLGLGRTHIVICVVGRALPWNSVVQELTPLDILPLLDVSDKLSSQRARQFWVEWNWDEMLICGSVSCSRFRSSSPSLVQRLSGDNWCLLTISPFWMSHKNYLKRKI